MYDKFFVPRLDRVYRHIVGTSFAVITAAVVTALVWWLAAGREGLLSWVAAATIVAVALGCLLFASVWNRRTLPLVTVAKFSSAGEKEPAEAEASALHDMIKSEIATAAESGHQRVKVAVRTLSQVIDPREDAALAIRAARGARAAVVVSGHVNVIGGSSAYSVRILIPQGRMQQPGSSHQAKLLSATPEQLDLNRTTLAQQAAATARVALGIALLNERKVELAREVLVGHLDGRDEAISDDTDPAVLFFGAFAAYLQKDYIAALRYSAVSWAHDQWAPAAALAAASAFEGGHREQGRTFLDVINSSWPAQAGWGDWIDTLMTLSYGLGLVDIVVDTNEKLNEISARVDQARQKLDAFWSRKVKISTLELFRDEEYEAVLADLAPVVPGEGSQKLALAALAQLRLGSTDQAARTAGYAAAEAERHPEEGVRAAGWLAEVFAHLGDAEQAAKWWDADLRHERTTMPEHWDWDMALLMGSLHLEPVWGSEPLQRIRARWSATESATDPSASAARTDAAIPGSEEADRT